MRIGIHLILCEGMIIISQSMWQVMQPLKTREASVLMAKGHWKHSRHQHLDAAKTNHIMFGSSLIDHNGIDTSLEIIIDEHGEVISQIHIRVRLLIEVLE